MNFFFDCEFVKIGEIIVFSIEVVYFSEVVVDVCIVFCFFELFDCVECV